MFASVLLFDFFAFLYNVGTKKIHANNSLRVTCMDF